MVMRDLLICSPNKMTDATVEITMAAAAEKPFIILSVYFTTTDVYKPPTLARTGNTKRSMSAEILWWKKNYIRYRTIQNKIPSFILLTHYEAHPGRITEKEAFFQDFFTISHVNNHQRDGDARQVHLYVPYPQRCVWALQYLFKVHTLIRI